LSESQNITPQFTKFKEDSLIDLIENEQRLFDSRKSDLQSSIQILDQRLIQKENRINELFSEVESAKRIAGLLGQEIETISPLVSSGLAPETRLLTLLRENEKNKNIILIDKQFSFTTTITKNLIKAIEKNVEKRKFGALIHSGYALPTGGHAIYIHIIKEKIISIRNTSDSSAGKPSGSLPTNNGYSFRVYNSGEGINFHPTYSE
jgi:hypothetical protein